MKLGGGSTMGAGVGVGIATPSPAKARWESVKMQVKNAANRIFNLCIVVSLN